MEKVSVTLQLTDEQAKSAVAQLARGRSHSSGNHIDRATMLEIASVAVQLYAETHPRPTQVTKAQAAEMLGISRPTIYKLIAAGNLRLNKCGMIPVSEIDAALVANGR